MSDLKEIKKRIKSVQDTQKITNAMYLIASSKLNVNKRKNYQIQNFADSFQDNISDILVYDKSFDSFLSCNNQTITYILFGPDKGFCGDYTKNILRSFENISNNAGPDNIIIFSKQLIKLFENSGIKYNTVLSDYSLQPNIESAIIIVDLIYMLIQNKQTDIVFVYTEFSNTQPQNVSYKKILPIKCSNKREKDIDYIPDKYSVYKSVIYEYILSQTYSTILNSICSEQNARMIAMDAANKNAKELVDELTVEYYRSRQNSITEEIIEITSNS